MLPRESLKMPTGVGDSINFVKGIWKKRDARNLPGHATVPLPLALLIAERKPQLARIVPSHSQAA